MERQPNPEDPAYRDKSTKKKLDKKKTKTPGQQLEESKEYIDSGKGPDSQGNLLMIKRDPTVQQNLNRDKIKYGPTDQLIKEGKLKEAAEKHPDRNKYKLQINQAVQKLVQTGRNALSIGSGLWKTYRALSSLR